MEPLTDVPPVPSDPFEGLHHVPLKPPREIVACDEDYLTDGTWLFLADAVVKRAPWMAAMAKRVPEHCKGAMGPGDQRVTPIYEGLLARAAARAPLDGARVELACVFSDEPEWAPLDDPGKRRARFVDAEGALAVDVDASTLKRAVDALAPDAFTQGGPSDAEPLVLWREGLVAGVVMGIRSPENPSAPEERVVAGRPAPSEGTFGRFPRWEPPPGQALHDGRDVGGKGIVAGVEKWAQWLGAVPAPPDLGAPGGAWLAPTRVGPMLLWVVPGSPDVVGVRYAFPRRAYALVESRDLLQPPLIVEAHPATGLALTALAEADDYDRMWAALARLALAPELRPTPGVLGAEARARFGPWPTPTQPGLLAPGARRAYVAVAALDAARVVVPNCWQVLDRQRWVRLRGHASRKVIERHVARLNKSARLPWWPEDVD